MDKWDERIEDIMFPNNGNLYKEDECYKSTIVDIELDPLECEFLEEDCVKINTSNLKYIMLSVENLHQLLELIDEAQELNSKNEK